MQQNHMCTDGYQFYNHYSWSNHTNAKGFLSAPSTEFGLYPWIPDTSSSPLAAAMSLCSSPNTSLLSSPTSCFQPTYHHLSPMASHYNSVYSPLYENSYPSMPTMYGAPLSPSDTLFMPTMPLRYDNYVEKTSTKPIKSKIYDCTLCSRSFARKHDLQRHIRVHTGAKPYYCLHCEKSFARTDALKRHLRMEENCRMSPVIQALKNVGMRRYRNL